MKNRVSMAMVLAVIGCAVMVGAVKLKAAAASGSASAGNFAADGGRVAFYGSDFTYLKDEINSLQSETDRSVIPALPAGSIVVSPDGSRRDLIRSAGTIHYDGGKVVISAIDLLGLADGIDAVERDYREVTAAALNSIGTYFDAGGNANHTTADGAGYVPPSCEQLMQGLLYSQSVDHLEDTPVTSDNITAGAAAWVNGHCVIGNGADNETAYQRGREDGRTGNDENIDIQYTRHEHVTADGQSGWEDNSAFTGLNSPGGCFTAGRHEHSSACPVSEPAMEMITYHDYTDECGTHPWQDLVACQHKCNGCGEIHRHEATKTGYNGSIPGANPCKVAYLHRHYRCGSSPVNTWSVGCGKKNGQIETAAIYLCD